MNPTEPESLLSNPADPRLLRDPWCALALGLGSGLSPRAPGTAGSLAAILLAWPLVVLSPWALLIAAIVSLPVGVFVCGRCSRKMGVHDHGSIVFDEFSGMWITLLAVPLVWHWWLFAFLAFRLFDVIKPWPISAIDRRVHGGVGIMLDDVIAGLFALCCVQLAILFT